MTITGTVKNIIDTVANQYGVAPWVAEDIAQVESGGNPASVGDHGTSFGLFQLHWGGQGTGYTANQLEDPTLNSQIGIRNLAPAYKKGVAQGLSGLTLLDYTASNSGHPGYGGLGAYPQYDALLSNAYNGGGGSSTSPSTNVPGVTTMSDKSAQGSNAFPSSSDVISEIDQALSLNGFNVLNPTGSLMQNAGAIGLRLVITLIGVLCVAFGLLAIVKKVS